MSSSLFVVLEFGCGCACASLELLLLLLGEGDGKDRVLLGAVEQCRVAQRSYVALERKREYSNYGEWCGIVDDLLRR